MAYLPREPAGKGERYMVYKEAKDKVKTKARLLKEALSIAEESEEHAEEIDFIPSKFTLQLHGWLSEDSPVYEMKSSARMPYIQNEIRKFLKAGQDPLKQIEKKIKAKSHYDLRIQKRTAPTWFGLTPFRAPWTGTADNKVLGTVKGYQVLTPGGKKLQRFLAEQAEKEMAKEGVAERRDRIEWMKIKAQWFPKNSPGNPTKNLDAYMVAIEFYKPACLHRRELDFFDITFFGDYLKGRFYNRLVERKMNREEMTEWQKEAIDKKKAKAFYNLSFYFWKAKDQWGDAGLPYSMKEVRSAALGKKALDSIPAPPEKGKKIKKDKGPKPPLASKEFH